MKHFKIILIFIAFFSIGSIISSCGNKKKATETELQGKEYASAYVCPMHCEGSGSDVAGTCPVCGMDYEKNEDHKADGHNHN